MKFQTIGQKLDQLVCKIIGHDKQLYEGIAFDSDMKKVSSWGCKRCGIVNLDVKYSQENEMV